MQRILHVCQWLRTLLLGAESKGEVRKILDDEVDFSIDIRAVFTRTSILSPSTVPKAISTGARYKRELEQNTISIYWLAESSGNHAQRLKDFGLLGAPVVIEWTFPSGTVTYYSWHVVIESSREVEPVLFNRNARIDGPIQHGEPESLLEAGLESYLMKSRQISSATATLRSRTALTFPLTRPHTLGIRRRFSLAHKKPGANDLNPCQANVHLETGPNTGWTHVGDYIHLPRADTRTFTVILLGVAVAFRQRGEIPESLLVEATDSFAVVEETPFVSQRIPSNVRSSLPIDLSDTSSRGSRSKTVSETLEDGQSPAPSTGTKQHIQDIGSDKLHERHQSEPSKSETVSFISSPTISTAITPTSTHQTSPDASPRQLHPPMFNTKQEIPSAADTYGAGSSTREAERSSAKSPSTYWTLDQSTGRYFHIDELPNGRKKTIWYPSRFA